MTARIATAKPSEATATAAASAACVVGVLVARVRAAVARV